MSQHHGAHPRMGATDVCPFVPVEGVTMDDCADLARRLGERVGRELEIPVYLYEQAASRPERSNLAAVRKGEYEGLDEEAAGSRVEARLRPGRASTRAPAPLIIGAREFLIAYNVTLNTRDKAHATDIAFELREKGRVARRGQTERLLLQRAGSSRYAGGRVSPAATAISTAATFADTERPLPRGARLRPARAARAERHRRREAAWSGRRSTAPGQFTHCKAIGWYVDEYKRAQISINLTNYKVTPPHDGAGGGAKPGRRSAAWS